MATAPINAPVDVGGGPIWTIDDFPMPNGVPPVSPSVLSTRCHPVLLQVKWQQVTEKLNGFTKVIEFPESLFRLLDDGARSYMAHRFM